MLNQKLWIAIVFASALAYSYARWLNYPTPGTPRTPDGKPNRSARAPRASNGKPGLSGLWQIEPPDSGELQRIFGDLSAFVVLGDDFSKYFLNILADFKHGEEPMRPGASSLFQKRAEALGQEGPASYCLPLGSLRSDLIPVPYKII
jgi:hypothetical protein